MLQKIGNTLKLKLLEMKCGVKCLFRVGVLRTLFYFTLRPRGAKILQLYVCFAPGST